MDKIQDSYTWFELLSLGYTVVKLIFHENSGNRLSKKKLTVGYNVIICHFSLRNHAKINASDKKMAK